MAYSANDENMIKAFIEGRDMHKFMASLVHHKPYDEVTSEERRNAKACLTENNYLKLLSGEFVSIRDLDKYIGEWCYGRDVLGMVVPAQIEHWELTKSVDEVLEIELDNGIVIECTPDHKILLENGVKIPAEDLNINDIIASFTTRVSENQTTGLTRTAKIISIKRKKLANPIPVYDIQTSEGNFAVFRNGNPNAGSFVSNCNFGILYGKSVASLAMDVSDGNVNEAQELMDFFFKTFPGIKKFIDAKHREVDEKGYVTNFLGGVINVDMTASGNAAYRQAQNYPLQSMGSMLAGTFMYFFTQELEKAGIKTAPYGFVHDAYDDSIPVDYLIEYLNIQKKVLQFAIRETIGAPVAIDQEIGPNALYYMGLTVLKAESDTIRVKLSGDTEGLDELIRKLQLSTTYTVQNIEVLESSEVTHSFEELFTVGKALKHEWGRTIKEQTIELDLVYHSGKHPDVSYLIK